MIIKAVVASVLVAVSLPALANTQACGLVVSRQTDVLSSLPKAVRESRIAPMLRRYWQDPSVAAMQSELLEHEGRFMSKVDLGGMRVVFRSKQGKKKTKIFIESIQEAGAEWGERPDSLRLNFVKLVTAVLKLAADEKAKNPERKVVIIADDLANLTLVSMLSEMGFTPEKENGRALGQAYEIQL